MTALDKLESTTGYVGAGAAEGLGEIEKAGKRSALEALYCLDKLPSKTFGAAKARPKASRDREGFSEESNFVALSLGRRQCHGQVQWNDGGILGSSRDDRLHGDDQGQGNSQMP